MTSSTLHLGRKPPFPSERAMEFGTHLRDLPLPPLPAVTARRQARCYQAIMDAGVLQPEAELGHPIAPDHLGMAMDVAYAVDQALEKVGA